MAGLRDSRLFEREREVAAIDAAVEGLRGGAGRLLVVEGPAGVGKTRLVGVARERARASGCQDLVVRASELERSFVFGVVRQLLERRVAELGDAERARVFSGRAEMASRALGLDREPARAESDAKLAAFSGLFWLCVELARERPLLLAVDDAHWCDGASLGWLAFAASRFEGLPILLLVAC